MAEISTTRTVTGQQLMKVLRSCARIKRPVFIWGPMGVGKSSMVAQLCAEMGGRFYDVRLSQCEQTDLRGIPYYNKESNKMEWAPPVDLPTEEEASKYPVVFLFLDEMNSAAPSVQAAAYQLVLDRGVGTYKLPENCVIFAAGNRDSDRGVTYRQPAPLANRFVHVELRVDADSWSRWAMDNQIHPDVVSFIEFSKNSLFDFDPKSSSRSFATPRSWEFVSEFLKDPQLDESVIADLIAGTVGEGMALKFLAHRKNSSNLPNPKDVLGGKVKELKTKEISAMYSLAISCAYELKAAHDEKDKNWYNKADNVLRFFMDCLTTEVMVMAIRVMLQQYHLPFTPSKLTNFKEFHERFGSLILKATQV